MTARSGAVALAIGVFVPSLAVYPGVRQGIVEAIAGRTVVGEARAAAVPFPKNPPLFPTPEEAAVAAVLRECPGITHPKAKLLMRFPPPDDYDTRVVVKADGGFSRFLGVQRNRPGVWSVTTPYRPGYYAPIRSASCPP